MIIGPPDRDPDALAPGMRWCACGLHQYPAVTTPNMTRVHTGCPVCVEYEVRIASLRTANPTGVTIPPSDPARPPLPPRSGAGDRIWPWRRTG